VKLNELVRTSSQKQGKHTIVAITFDDGWFSTWKELLPVLFENKIPSTLYLSTNYHEKKLPIVSVVISYMIWKSSNIKISIQGINNYINGNYHLDNKTESARLIENVSNWIEKTTPNHSEVLNILYKIAECACVNPNDLALDTRRFDPLTPLEISHCSNNNCAIELHGHNHSYPRGDPEQFENDLNKCINSIKSYSLPPPMHYCYPSGNYDEIAASILKKNRVISATTCDPGLVNIENGNDIYYLPRFLDGENIHMLEFEAEMSGFNELARRLLSKTAINY
jgi:peptidoglycan/xylan/chitin deacetylase (PgdA/CDA1 family)